MTDDLGARRYLDHLIDGLERGELDRMTKYVERMYAFRPPPPELPGSNPTNTHKSEPTHSNVIQFPRPLGNQLPEDNT
ncbi:hypothetical protein JOD54_002133 [Actinokineospora baliensis]|uniref:hypothetical protein n=1 Tax=Actinokineospora baliensis TaxID=547056 RepID=UPI00195ECE3E|nr:hypothetical protein [Actinokineospora baliensis]MBM7771929.1 hypothetical protein [Actinokineospora baliensis]